METGDRNFAFCGSCGSQNPARNKFCAKCGALIQGVQKIIKSTEDMVKCPHCGNLNGKTTKFCSACSYPITADLKVSDEGDYIFIQVNFEQIDFENNKDLATVVKKMNDPRVLVDLSKVQWMDSTGIGALITIVHRMTHQGQEIKFTGIGPRVMNAIKALQADNVLDIFETKSDALVSWGLPPE